MDPEVRAQPNSPTADERVDRLSGALDYAAEQQAATSEVLETIGAPELGLMAVFETVVRHAVRLGGADGGFVYQLDGDVFRLAVAEGGPDEYHRYLADHPVSPGPGSLVGRTARECQAQQIADAAADPEYEWHEARDLAGFHTMLGVPMVADGRVVGVIGLWRTQVEPFDELTVGLVTTFAAEGVIATQDRRARPGAEGAQLRTRSLGRRVARARRGQSGCQLKSRSRLRVDDDCEPSG
jgi:signal transduction protein with GAF and PtsI domain